MTANKRFNHPMSEDAKNRERAEVFQEQLEKSRHERADDANAFVKQGVASNDDLADTLAKNYLIAAQEGHEPIQEASDEQTDEDTGGPFVVTQGEQEFASGYDESNPPDAEPAAFPTVTRSR